MLLEPGLSSEACPRRPGGRCWAPTDRPHAPHRVFANLLLASPSKGGAFRNFTSEYDEETVKYDTKFSNQILQETRFSISPGGAGERGTWIEPFSWKPRAFVIHNILTDEECDHLISLAEPSVKASTVVTNSAAHEEGVSKARTSFGTFLKRYHDEIVGRMEEKVAIMTGVPMANGESMQILRYERHQRYTKHEDFFDRAYLLEADGMQRMATILLYLSDVDSGGETNFPMGTISQEYRASNGGVEGVRQSNEECGGALQAAVKPKKGDALLFYDMDPQCVYEDRFSLHEGCPVLEGIKWSATIWMHQQHFRGHEYSSEPTPCEDTNDSCASWAKNGECKKNPAYMHSSCTLSCGLCRQCQHGDVLCERKNRFAARAKQGPGRRRAR